MTTNEMPELKPCPFCKGKMSKGLTKKTGCQMHGDPIQYVTLLCSNPSCPVKPFITGGCRYRGGDEPEYEAEERKRLAEKWNGMLEGTETPEERHRRLNPPLVVNPDGTITLLTAKDEEIEKLRREIEMLEANDEFSVRLLAQDEIYITELRVAVREMGKALKSLADNANEGDFISSTRIDTAYTCLAKHKHLLNEQAKGE